MIIIPDSPLAHEAVMKAWEANDTCCVLPAGFHDPSAYMEAHAGGPGIYLYLQNLVGGFDMLHVSWESLAKRLSGTTLTPFVGRTLTMFGNRWTYGLVMGRLYMLKNGGSVVPYRNSNARAFRDIDDEGVETLIGSARYIAPMLDQFPRPTKGTLKAMINICDPLDEESLRVVKTRLGVRVYNHFGLTRCGTIAFSDGRALEPGEVGNLVVEAELRDGDHLYVRSPSTYPQFDLGGGWCSTGKRARIDGQRLFLLGDYVA